MNKAVSINNWPLILPISQQSCLTTVTQVNGYTVLLYVLEQTQLGLVLSIYIASIIYNIDIKTILWQQSQKFRIVQMQYNTGG